MYFFFLRFSFRGSQDIEAGKNGKREEKIIPESNGGKGI
jgi:hypothetical protein